MAKGKQAPITAEALNALEAICFRLTRLPITAPFAGVRSYVYDAEYSDLRAGMLFWDALDGWQLLPTWRETLAAKRAALATQTTEQAGG